MSNSTTNSGGSAVRCWALAGVIGLVVLIFLAAVAGYSWGAAIFLGLLTCGILGFVFTWLYCAETPAVAEHAPARGGSATAARTTGTGAPAASGGATPAPRAEPKAAPKPEAAKPEPATAETPAAEKPAAEKKPAAESARTESAKSESAKTEPAKSETAKTETAKTETAKTEPAKSETAKTEPAKAKAAPAKTSASKTEARAGSKSSEGGGTSEVEAKGGPAADGTKSDAEPRPGARGASEVAATEGTKPKGLDGPRDGKADNLKEIKGVGPKLEGLLHDLGIYHFDQIAGWSGDEVAWVDENLKGFRGRVTRDDWIEQAEILASGGETEFSKRVDKGGVY